MRYLNLKTEADEHLRHNNRAASNNNENNDVSNSRRFECLFDRFAAKSQAVSCIIIAGAFRFYVSDAAVFAKKSCAVR